MDKRILVPVDGNHASGAALAAALQLGSRSASPGGPLSFVSTDVAALASHMDACKQSQGPLFLLRSGADVLRGVVSSRIVSTGALLVVAVLALLLYLS